MATKAARGTKRTCQNPDCGARFYDLNRDPIVCPICESAYVIAVSAPSTGADKGRRAKKPEFETVVTEKEAAPELDGDELAAVEDAEEPVAAAEEDTFLEEEEEEGGDMSNIIGGPVSEEGEEQ
jgi:uncharacterized protein (TIGR02300 family)